MLIPRFRGLLFGPQGTTVDFSRKWNTLRLHISVRPRETQSGSRPPMRNRISWFMGHIPRCFTFAESDDVEHQLHVAFEAPWFPSRQAGCAICVPSTAAPAAATAPRLSCLAESDRHLMAFMNRRAIEPRLRPNSDTMCLLHQDDMERLLAWHALENTRAISDRERLAAIIPMQVNRCPGAMLVFIAIPTVLIEQEIRIFTAIDARAASFVSEFLSLVLAGKNSDTNDAALASMAVKMRISCSMRTVGMAMNTSMAPGQRFTCIGMIAARRSRSEIALVFSKACQASKRSISSW